MPKGASERKRKNNYFFFAEIMHDAGIPPQREGRTRGRHDMRGGDAVGV
jgi:hypothetical protein